MQATSQLQKLGVASTDDTPKFDAKKSVRATVLALFDGKVEEMGFFFVVCVLIY